MKIPFSIEASAAKKLSSKTCRTRSLNKTSITFYYLLDEHKSFAFLASGSCSFFLSVLEISHDSSITVFDLSRSIEMSNAIDVADESKR